MASIVVTAESSQLNSAVESSASPHVCAVLWCASNRITLSSNACACPLSNSAVDKARVLVFCGPVVFKAPDQDVSRRLSVPSNSVLVSEHSYTDRAVHNRDGFGCLQPPVAPQPPLPEVHRQLGPLYTFAPGNRAPQFPNAQGVLQQQQQHAFNFEVTSLLAREYHGFVQRTRQRQMAELQAQLANGTVPGFKTVRLFAHSHAPRSFTHPLAAWKDHGGRPLLS
jgi:hypothetical protein